MTEITPWEPRGQPEQRAGIEPWQAQPGPAAAEPLWCEGTGCQIWRRRRPATVVLYFIAGQEMSPCCDECARPVYNHRPGYFRLLPVSDYIDQYAEAR